MVLLSYIADSLSLVSADFPRLSDSVEISSKSLHLVSQVL